MVADGLHAQHATFPNHDIGIRSPTLCSTGDLEGVSACLGAAAAAEVPRESGATLCTFCTSYILRSHSYLELLPALNVAPVANPAMALICTPPIAPASSESNSVAS
jgi:hypothetical protein